MSKVQTFAWCTLSAMIGFSAAQFSPPLGTGRAPQAQLTTPPLQSAGQRARPAAGVLAPAPPPRAAPQKPPAVTESRPAPGPPLAAELPAPAPMLAPAASRAGAPLLSSFRFAGIGAHGGVRLGRVTRGSLPDLLGLKTGDEIITLNGLRIADPQKALQAYAQLPHVDHWIARIHRDGLQKEVRYALR